MIALLILCPKVFFLTFIGETAYLLQGFIASVLPDDFKGDIEFLDALRIISNLLISSNVDFILLSLINESTTYSKLSPDFIIYITRDRWK